MLEVADEYRRSLPDSTYDLGSCTPGLVNQRLGLFTRPLLGLLARAEKRFGQLAGSRGRPID